MEKSLHLSWGGNLKSVDDQGLLEGDAIVFGSESSPDISPYKDFFTQDTHVHPEDSFMTSLYLEHGYAYDDPIGKALMVKTDKGWVATAELYMDNPVVKAKFPEIKSGGWGFSTGAVGHIVKRTKKSNGTHHITQWNVGELSITKTPAEPKALIHSVKSLDEYYSSSDEYLDTEEDPTNDMPDMQHNEDTLMKIIEMLISELTKKHIEDLVVPELNEIKSLLESFKTNKPQDTALPNGNEEDNKLTVLKSVYDELFDQNAELQSSFNDKEALLSQKDALLSEIQAQLDTKSQEVNTLEEALTNAQEEIEELKEKLAVQKKVNRALTTSKLKL